MTRAEWSGDDPDAMTTPIVVAPWTFWVELEKQTGGMEATVPFLAWWVRKNSSHHVKATGHLIAVGIADSSLADR
jgi:hypothetical protein